VSLLPTQEKLNTSPRTCQALFGTPEAAAVKLYPELSAAALQSSQDKQLALWYCLRAINRTGSGILDYQRAIETLSDYGYSVATARRHLRQGSGQLWAVEDTTESHRRIVIFSLLKVCQYLSVSRVSSPVEVSQVAFRGLRKRRAALYAGWLCHRDNRPTSREAITVATGLARRRQQRYDAVAGIVKVRNYALTEVSGQLEPIMALVEGKSQAWWIPKQLPSSFRADVTQAALGMTRKVNAALRGCFNRADATTSFERAYFDSASQAVRSKNRAETSYFRGRGLSRGIQGWIAV